MAKTGNPGAMRKMRMCPIGSSGLFVLLLKRLQLRRVSMGGGWDFGWW